MRKRDNFWNYVDRRGPDDCWLWTSTRTHAYGRLSGTLKAHRLSYEIAYGSIPEGAWVLHKCDTPLCVNPKHLYLGTPLDNMHDMHSRGRNAKTKPNMQGDRNHAAKLTRDQVQEIILMQKAGVASSRIGKIFGIHHSTVRRVVTGASWKCLQLQPS